MAVRENRYDDVRLVGLAGAAGAGKDTIATLMVLDNWKHVAFADPLKDICVRHLGLSWDDVRTQEGKARFNDFWGMTNRAILQRVGTDAMRNGFDRDVWVKIMELKLRDMLMYGDRVIVTDCRFDNEAELIYRLGGVVARVVRTGAALASMSAGDRAHVSESGVSGRLVAFDVVNDYDVPRLRTEFMGKLEAFKRRHASAVDRLWGIVEDGLFPAEVAGDVSLMLKSRVMAEVAGVYNTVNAPGVRLEFARGGLEERCVVVKGDGSASLNVLVHGNGVRNDSFSSFDFKASDADAWAEVGERLSNRKGVA